MKERVRNKPITSTEGLIRIVTKQITKNKSVHTFFRGHSDKSYTLEPALFRNIGHLRSEDLMLRELIVTNPGDFTDDTSTLEKLVRMQHYGLPTRLLDVTSNPLMALYFACEGQDKKEVNGEVLVFTIDESRSKFYDSDTVCCIANLAQLSHNEKESIKPSADKNIFNECDGVKELVYHIQKERPHFTADIEPRDLERIVCVRTKMSNARIVSQSGAFLLFGLRAQLDTDSDGITFRRISVRAEAKNKILKELDGLNINESTVFPYIETSAKYISKKYAE